MAKKEITNEELALMIKGGFDKVDERFEGVDRRFESVDKRFEKLDQGQDDIKLRLTNVAYRFELEEVKLKMAQMEKGFDRKIKQLEKLLK